MLICLRLKTIRITNEREWNKTRERNHIHSARRDATKVLSSIQHLLAFAYSQLLNERRQRRDNGEKMKIFTPKVVFLFELAFSFN